MWTRSLLKENAKIAFKRNYWTCVIVGVILALLGAGAEGAGITFNYNAENTQSNVGHGGYGSITGKYFILLSAIGVIVLFAMILAIIFSTFVTNIVMIGGKRYFMENREHKTMVGQIFYGFQSGYYLNCVKTMFFRDIYVLGWTLLFIVPGIIKGYAYKLVPYIMAENPGLSKDRAISLSEDMMRGHKFETFVLELSFIGWDFLNACTIGILGLFYVAPYKHATYAELYSAIKAEAMQKGITDSIELPGVAYQEFKQEFYQETFTQEEPTGYSEDIFEEE